MKTKLYVLYVDERLAWNIAEFCISEIKSILSDYLLSGFDSDEDDKQLEFYVRQLMTAKEVINRLTKDNKEEKQ